LKLDNVLVGYVRRPICLQTQRTITHLIFGVWLVIKASIS